MGKITYVVIFVLFFSIIKSQNVVVKIEKKDSIKLIPQNSKEYYLRLYNLDNIKYNHNKTKIIQIDNKIYCKDCKREYIVYSVKRINQKLTKPQIITLDQLRKQKLNDFFNGYFMINKIYYKAYGTIEN